MLSVSSSLAPRFFPTRTTISHPPPRFSSVRCRSSIANSDHCFQKIQIRRSFVHTQRYQTEPTFDAYLVNVGGDREAPGVVVLQDCWGMDDYINNIAFRISHMGLDPGLKALVIPDLYKGKEIVGDEARMLYEKTEFNGAVVDIWDSFRWLKEDGSYSIGVTGFGMGAALAIASIVGGGEDLDFIGVEEDCYAAVAFYGIPSSHTSFSNQRPSNFVQAHIGELDNLVGFSDVTASQAANELKEKWKRVNPEVHIYSGQRYGFMTNPPYDEDEAVVQELAWERFNSVMVACLYDYYY